MRASLQASPCPSIRTFGEAPCGLNCTLYYSMWSRARAKSGEYVMQVDAHRTALRLVRQISPWHTYYTSMLPKLMLLAYPLALLGSIMHTNVRQLCLPIYVYITAMSVLKHKEWRFIVYTIPFLNVSAIAGIRYVWVRSPCRVIPGTDNSLQPPHNQYTCSVRDFFAALRELLDGDARIDCRLV